MTTWYLINNVRTVAGLRIAGDLVDDAQESLAPLQAAGGLLVISSDAVVAAAAGIALQMKLNGADPIEIEAVMAAAYQQQQQSEILGPVADATALAAVLPALRQRGTAVVKLDDMTPWGFDTLSAAAAAAGVIVPAVGTGRWHRGYIFSGCPMQNRLRMLGAPGIIVTGNTITIGADVYEIRPGTPPVGGTAGRHWVYTGADSHAARVNLADAINGVVDPTRIAYAAGGVVEHFLAEHDHVTVGDLTIVSADAPGGNPIPSNVATACTETLTTATDIWDNATCRFGALAGALQHSRAVVTILAADIAKAAFQIHFNFTPFSYSVVNRTTLANMEAVTIVGNSLNIALSGGAPPAIQANDVLEIKASE